MTDPVILVGAVIGTILAAALVVGLGLVDEEP